MQHTMEEFEFEGGMKSRVMVMVQWYVSRITYFEVSRIQYPFSLILVRKKYITDSSRFLNSQKQVIWTRKLMLIGIITRIGTSLHSQVNHFQRGFILDSVNRLNCCFTCTSTYALIFKSYLIFNSLAGPSEVQAPFPMKSCSKYLSFHYIQVLPKKVGDRYRLAAYMAYTSGLCAIIFQLYSYQVQMYPLHQLQLQVRKRSTMYMHVVAVAVVMIYDSYQASHFT